MLKHILSISVLYHIVVLSWLDPIIIMTINDKAIMCLYLLLWHKV